MAQPSVAREPSMEEILASIRRIIESNETGPAGAFSGQLPPVYDDEDGAASEAAFVAEPVSPPARVPPAANQAFGARPAQDFSPASEKPAAERQESQGEKTMSLADVAARVRAAADRNAAMGPQAFAAQAQRGASEATPASSNVSQPVAAPSAERAAPQRPTDVRPLMAAVASASEQPVPFASEDRAAAAAIESAPLAENRFDQLTLRGAIEMPLATERFDVTVREPAVEMPAFDLAELETKDRADVEDGLSLNLLSAAAGAQIARSFSELAEVFDGVERRSIEDLAADMLRPMLQDWLEDNLPTLVERLVREEIERVARGSRR
ncbi:cell division protein PopZ [Rhizobium sp. BR 250]